MNTLEGNAALTTRAATTSPTSEPKFEPQATVPPAMSAAPVLITEKEVLFGSAVAVPVRPITTRWWSKATGVVLAAMHRMSLTSSVDSQEPRRDYPRHYEFLERACMGREMDRL